MSKQAYIWDSTSSTWISLGFQTAAAPYLQKFGSSTVTITANPTTQTVTLPAGFTIAPYIFTQMTSTTGGNIQVTAKATGSFTVSISGLSSGTVTYDWYAAQPSA